MKTVPSKSKGLLAIGVGTVALATFISGVGNAASAGWFHDDHKSGHATEMRDLGAFTKIRTKGGLELKVAVGQSQSVEVTADDDYISDVETYVSGDTLVIDMSDKHDFWDDADVAVKITMPSFEGIEVLGAIDGEISGVHGGKVEVEIKGAADLEIEGTCDELQLSIKGAGDVDAKDLVCGVVDVDVKGVGSATVYASEAVDASVGGIGEISVYGSPKQVKQNAGGIGSVRIR